MIPGVIAYSIAYLTLKLANYGIMYWIPLYAQKHLGMDDHQSTNVATLYDVGTLVGCVGLGLITDKTPGGKRSPALVTGLVLATIGHIFLLLINEGSRNWIYPLIFILGMLVGAIANTLAGTCVADLGKKEAV